MNFFFPLLLCLSIDFEVITVVATDLDEPKNDNSEIRYKIKSQDPKLPSDPMFVINPVSGAIRINAGGLDREVSSRDLENNVNPSPPCGVKSFQFTTIGEG